MCPPACVRWAALHAGRTHQSVKAGLWRSVEKQPGHKLVRLICIRCSRRETPLMTLSIPFHSTIFLWSCHVYLCQCATLTEVSSLLTQRHLVNLAGINCSGICWRILLNVIKLLSHWGFVLNDTGQSRPGLFHVDLWFLSRLLQSGSCVIDWILNWQWFCSKFYCFYLDLFALKVYFRYPQRRVCQHSFTAMVFRFCFMSEPQWKQALS